MKLPIRWNKKVLIMAHDEAIGRLRYNAKLIALYGNFNGMPQDEVRQKEKFQKLSRIDQEILLYLLETQTQAQEDAAKLDAILNQLWKLRPLSTLVENLHLVTAPRSLSFVGMAISLALTVASYVLQETTQRNLLLVIQPGICASILFGFFVAMFSLQDKADITAILKKVQQMIAKDKDVLIAWTSFINSSNPLARKIEHLWEQVNAPQNP